MVVFGRQAGFKMLFTLVVDWGCIASVGSQGFGPNRGRCGCRLHSLPTCRSFRSVNGVSVLGREKALSIMVT
jgi:hypothetical protein